MEAFGDSSICRTNVKVSKLTCQKTEVSCGDKTRLNPRNQGILSLSPVILELYSASSMKGSSEVEARLGT